MVISLSRVDLPAPLRPTRAARSPICMLKSTFLKISLAFGTGGGEAEPAAVLALAAVVALADFSSRCGYAKRTPTTGVDRWITAIVVPSRAPTVHANEAAVERTGVREVEHDFSVVDDLVGNVCVCACVDMDVCGCVVV